MRKNKELPEIRTRVTVTKMPMNGEAKSDNVIVANLVSALSLYCAERSMWL